MKQLIKILTFHSVKELLRYKSFLFLIFFLIFADRMIHRFVKTPEKGFNWPQGYEFGEQTAGFVFTQLPEKLLQWVFTPRVVLVAAGLFLLKQVISLWPSSDMRRMHRQERGRFGVMEALAVLRWNQVVWDALAVGLVCGAMALWVGLAYLAGWGIWSRTPTAAGLFVAGGLAAAAFPVAMAGFSYSSKLAVIRHGTFGARFRIFVDLFMSWRLLWTSWLFFSGRIVLEVLFVAIIPASAIILIDSFWLRMAVAAISATPVYAYLKMASFKFFLEAYRGYPLVRKEYGTYYARVG
ncbi:MAG: hypothetical protein PVJ84_17765 [Desulfobacteraceae bacterium]|jgi:hypothetical protein